MTSIPRNAPCFCTSGKKYKHCHGALSGSAAEALTLDVIDCQREEARQIQRQRQQGFGRPILAIEDNGTRFVTVGNEVMSIEADDCKSFHDFLRRYVVTVLGEEFRAPELKKAPADWHPIMKWATVFDRQIDASARDANGVAYGNMNGAAALFLNLAYDLYALAHNAELQAELLRRIRNIVSFNGARHEVFVAACFVRAGFDIEFEDEFDRRSTHCEFTATFKETGRKFSVEAKRREGSNRERFGHLINNALAKHAAYERVIFLEMNWDDPAAGHKRFQLRDFILKRLRRMELNPESETQPPAYIFVTNNPHEFALEGPQALCSATHEGFKIPTFKSGVVAELREVIDAREAHAEMYFLLRSMADHASPPVTFTGELPKAENGRIKGQVMIGDRLLIPDGSGGTCEALIEDALVNEAKRETMLIALLANGSRQLLTTTMSEIALQTWNKHPDTFFGVPKPRKLRPETPIELYDSFFQRTLKVGKEELLMLMKKAPNFAELTTLDQRKLASRLAENMVRTSLAQRTAREGPKFLEEMGCSAKWAVEAKPD